jgi:hypothetical protein
MLGVKTPAKVPSVLPFDCESDLLSWGVSGILQTLSGMRFNIKTLGVHEVLRAKALQV